jgi:hypothetical protein
VLSADLVVNVKAVKLEFEGTPLPEPVGTADAGDYTITWSMQNGIKRFTAYVFDATKRWHRRYLAQTHDFDIAVKVCEAHARRS